MAYNTTEDDNKKRKRPPLNLLLVALVGFNTIVVIGVAYFQYVLHGQQSSKTNMLDVVKEAENQANEEAKLEDLRGSLLALDDFTANLAQGDGPRRFIRLKMVLKFSKDSRNEEFGERKPQIRDVIINILNSKRAQDLLKAEGKTYLKKEIKEAVNSFLIYGHVMDVFYISFQIN